jgi:tryptophan-rich sensory protein
MREEFKDAIGQIFWYAIFFTPLITIPLMWKNKTIKKATRVVMGLFLAMILSFLFFFISISICFRNGMGPS